MAILALAATGCKVELARDAFGPESADSVLTRELVGNWHIGVGHDSLRLYLRFSAPDSSGTIYVEQKIYRDSSVLMPIEHSIVYMGTWEVRDQHLIRTPRQCSADAAWLEPCPAEASADATLEIHEDSLFVTTVSVSGNTERIYLRD